MIIATFYCYWGEGDSYETALANLTQILGNEYSEEDIEGRLSEIRFYEAERLSIIARRQVVFVDTNS